jgi:hypothetical protein
MRERTSQERADYSRGFDRGNYGNAYESTDWDSWNKRNAAASPAYQAGMMLGFFSSYELHEISDEIVRETVAYHRATWEE